MDPVESRRAAATDVGADLVLSPDDDVAGAVRELTGGLGADVTIEAVGIPATFDMAVDLVRPGGRVANIGVHGKPTTLHLEELSAAGWTSGASSPTGSASTRCRAPTTCSTTRWPPVRSRWLSCVGDDERQRGWRRGGRGGVDERASAVATSSAMPSSMPSARVQTSAAPS